MNKPRLVLFDFDGTITRKDTLLEFIRFYCGPTKFLVGFAILSPILIAMKLKVVGNQKAKERVLRYFFGNTPVEHFNARCREFAAQIIPNLVRSEAAPVFSEERSLNSVIAVVSASPENWVKPWCDMMNFQCHSTRLEIVDDKITGKIVGKNCYGAEKVNRIKGAFDLSGYQRIAAYGDSSGDTEMLAIADEKHYRVWG